MKKYFKILLWGSIFSISMAYLESAVVVYLREIYYPDGFAFPLQEITPIIYFTEMGREVATIIMLFAVSHIMSKTKRELFAFFSFNFAVWDIWYYIWLKILSNWPDSFFSWDILFLIPIPWVAPVLAPILISVLLIIAALIILKIEFKIALLDWLIEIIAGSIIVLSFLFQIDVIEFNKIPSEFPWWLFLLGMSIGFTWFIYRVIKLKYDN